MSAHVKGLAKVLGCEGALKGGKVSGARPESIQMYQLVIDWFVLLAREAVEEQSSPNIDLSYIYIFRISTVVCPPNNTA